MLQLRGVSKSFGGDEAVAPIDLTVAEGETTVLIGPSGSGKSTLLRLMIGLLWPDAGSVIFGGAPLTEAALPAVRRRMGYVIQEGGLFPHLTARRNVTLMARFLGWKRPDIDVRVSRLCDLTHFPEALLARYPLQLSGGQRQRVGLMRALMLDPEILLLDEPLGALDPMIRTELQADLGQIFRTLGKTVVLVTHDMGEAAHLGDVLVLMREGRIVQRGSLRDLLASPAEEFVSRFINAQRGLGDVIGARS